MVWEGNTFDPVDNSTKRFFMVGSKCYKNKRKHICKIWIIRNTII